MFSNQLDPNKGRQIAYSLYGDKTLNFMTISSIHWVRQIPQAARLCFMDKKMSGKTQPFNIVISVKVLLLR